MLFPISRRGDWLWDPGSALQTEENSAVARGQITMGRFGGLSGGETERGHHRGQGPKNCAPLECSGIKIAGRNMNNLRYADDTTLMAKSEEELKSLLMKVKEESEKTGLKPNSQKKRSWHLVPLLHGK